MNLLLDTQALIWFLEGDPRLADEAKRAIEDKENLKNVSVASGWEWQLRRPWAN